MESSHTPEPWHLIWPDRLGIYGPGDIHLATVATSPEPEIYIDHNANARLMVHAPEMYREIVATIRYLEVRHPEEGDIHCMACGVITDPQVSEILGVAHGRFCPVLGLRTVISKIANKVKT